MATITLRKTSALTVMFIAAMALGRSAETAAEADAWTWWPIDLPAARMAFLGPRAVRSIQEARALYSSPGGDRYVIVNGPNGRYVQRVKGSANIPALEKINFRRFMLIAVPCLGGADSQWEIASVERGETEITVTVARGLRVTENEQPSTACLGLVAPRSDHAVRVVWKEEKLDRFERLRAERERRSMAAE